MIEYAATGLSIPPDISIIPRPAEPTGIPLIPFIVSLKIKVFPSSLISILTGYSGFLTSTDSFPPKSSIILSPISLETPIESGVKVLSALFVIILKVPLFSESKPFTAE